MESADKLNEIIAMAALGFKLCPLHNPVGDGCSCGDPQCAGIGKHPRVNWKNSATSQISQIRLWHETWPEANWGAATGGESGIVVLDVDGADGQRSLAEWTRLHGELPETLTSMTGKGFHHIFKMPEEPMPNRTRVEPGLDVRANGGYIVVPPSLHANGNRYRWQDAAAKIADLPEWLELAMRARSRSPQAVRSRAESAPKEQEAPTQTGIITGERNSRLHAEAGRLRSMGYSTDLILPLILEMNQKRCIPPLEPEEVALLVESAGRYDPDQYRGIHYTDAGNAELMARKYQGDVIYCQDIRSFLVYDGTRYVKDTENRVEWLMKETLKTWMTAANEDRDEDRRKRTIHHILKSENQGRVKAAVDSLKSEPGMSVGIDQFDRDIWKFNAANGTIDLKSGKLLPHDKKDLLMKSSKVAYDPNAGCPNWVRFVDGITNGDAELQSFLQEAMGYSLSGDTSEQCLFILHGSGANGKSTFIEIAREVLGDYGMQIPVETLLVRKHEGVGNDIAALRGARFAAASEAEKGQALAESKIKQLVAGNDKVAARFLYGEFFEYAPQFKIFLATNWMPKISGTDQGIWRRIRLIPFEVAFLDPKIHPDVPENRRQDRNLSQKLRLELPGILNWMVEGCLRWQRQGLSRPRVVQAATESYREDNDPVGQFIAECCDKKGVTPFSSIYDSYCEWALASRDRPIAKKEFSQRLVAKGFSRERKGRAGETVITGLSLVRLPELGMVAGLDQRRWPEL